MNSPSYKCPECEGTNFKRWELPHPIILHWVLNPGLAFNEIILGQRLPKTQLICQDCDGPMLDRAYVPCPSCKKMHLGRRASGKSGFGNWRGVACPSCGEPIPCIWNLFSRLILLVTFPLWALPYFLHFRHQGLRTLYSLENSQPPALKPVTRKTWILMGASWGGLMWVVMSVLPFLRDDARASRWSSILVELPIWGVGGFAFGFLMWFFLGRTPRPTKQGQQGGGGEQPAGEGNGIKSVSHTDECLTKD